MADTAIDKIEDALIAVLEAGNGSGQPLEGWTVLTDDGQDEAIDDSLWPALKVFITQFNPDQSEEQHQTRWLANAEIEFISGPQASGTINRKNRQGMAGAHGLLAADRTLGGMLEDMQEIDVSPMDGKDVGGATLLYELTYYTARDDWFTIYGQAGATF